MRLGVLDIGSNTVHMLVVDAHYGARPAPAADDRTVVRLMKYLDDDNRIVDEGVTALREAVSRAMVFAERFGAQEVIGMATSALREAANGPEVLAGLEELSGINLTVLSGKQEADLTFLAARRWHGWAAGRLLVLDIGGGSFEVAYGTDENPEFSASVPLGAGRLTRQFLTDDPPTEKQVEEMRDYIKMEMKPLADSLKQLPKPDHVVGTSKTFRSLARLGGQLVAVVGPTERRRMSRSDLEDWVPRLAKIPAAARTELPGITPERTFQIVAGAEVAWRAMKSLKLDRIEICPWAMREGAILHYLESQIRNGDAV
ncbi:Ppx/GppA family phosphatase [Flaviflexus salsibiostraticola]|uniref:Ppx/GppA family phosphatase n=1 Tax=Flaviflexus salsibiostraticola TaxID=1282737 RepID=A0A3Q8WTY1_9ACTO|nr:Ppx/GppA phosphatase family protein [Flaviflexus salsibiostraticola]AZN30230.1 Ppx/GppA family phosphatase [Flaviflexus salsibiostraticola]